MGIPYRCSWARRSPAPVKRRRTFMLLPEPQTQARREAEMLRQRSDGRTLLVSDDATGYR